MRWLLAIALAISAWAAHAQTVIVRTNEISGNVSPSEAIQGVAGVWRFTLYATDGGDPAELSAPVRFVVVDPADGHAVTSVPTVVSSGYIYRATVQIVQRTQPPFTLPYWAQYIRTDLDPSDTERILWWAEVSVTSVPPASAIVNASVVVTGAIAAVQKTASGPPADFDYTSKILTLNTAFVGSGGSGLITNVVEAHSNRWVPAQSMLIIDTNENLRSGSATINGFLITNNASIVFGLGVTNWIEGYETNQNIAGYYWAPANTPLITINRKPQFFIGTNYYIAFSRPDNTVTGGAARGNAAIDLQIVRALANQVASGASSAILGGQENRAAGNYSVVMGGRANQATALRSVVGGGENNVAGASDSLVLGGLNNSIAALSQFHFIINGSGNAINASDTHATILNGFQNSIAGDYPGDSYGANTILNGYLCQINASQESVFLGGWYSRITNSQFAVVFGESVTNEASRRTLLLNARASAIRSATNATILNAHNTTISGATNVVAIHTHGVVITQNNWAVIGNIWISLAGTNNPPREGAIAFANGNWRFAVSNQWRTPLYE